MPRNSREALDDPLRPKTQLQSHDHGSSHEPCVSQSHVGAGRQNNRSTP